MSEGSRDTAAIKESYEELGSRYGDEYDATEEYPQALFEFTKHVKRVDTGGGPHRVLDIGCGPGFESRYLADQGFKVTSVDVAAGMLKDARERGNVEVPIQADWLQLPFPNDSFHGVWAARVNIHIPPEGLDEIFGEVERVLVPKGIFCFVNFASVDKEAWDRWFKEVEQKFGKGVLLTAGQIAEHVPLPPTSPPFKRLAEPEPLAQPSEGILYIRWHYDPSLLEELSYNHGFIRVIGIEKTDSDGDVSTVHILKLVGEKLLRKEYGSYQQYCNALWRQL